MTKRSPKMHFCRNCGFMSPRDDLFLVVDGLLQCILCIEDYSELLFILKPTRIM
jgi:hypothetical protein